MAIPNPKKAAQGTLSSEKGQAKKAGNQEKNEEKKTLKTEEKATTVKEVETEIEGETQSDGQVPVPVAPVDQLAGQQ